MVQGCGVLVKPFLRSILADLEMTLHNGSLAGSSTCKPPIELWEKDIQDMAVIEEGLAAGKTWRWSIEVYYNNKLLNREVPL